MRACCACTSALDPSLDIGHVRAPLRPVRRFICLRNPCIPSRFFSALIPKTVWYSIPLQSSSPGRTRESDVMISTVADGLNSTSRPNAPNVPNPRGIASQDATCRISRGSELSRKPIVDLPGSIDSLRESLLSFGKHPPAHVAELLRNWYYLESAVRSAARDMRASLDPLPYLIFADYTRALSS